MVIFFQEMLRKSLRHALQNHRLQLTSGVSVQCVIAFRRSGMCAGYNQSKRNPYVRRLQKTNGEQKIEKRGIM